MNGRRIKTAFLAITVLLLLAPLAVAQEGYDLSWWTVDGGGGASTTLSVGYTLAGTAGQPDAGDHAGATAGGGTYTLQGGFWDTYPALQPTLAITKTAEDLDGPPLHEGDVVEYRITVTNTATFPHSNVLVQDAIPSGTTYVPGSGDPPPTTGPDPLVWLVQNLAPSESATFIFQVTVDEGLAGQTIGGNVAAVTSDQQEEPSVTPPVWPPGGGGVAPTPNLLIAKTAQDVNGPPLYEGDAIEYTITITNPSAAALSGVVVTDSIPLSTTYVAGSADPPPSSGPDPLVWAVGDLPGGESRTFTFRVTVDAGAVGRVIENQARVGSDDSDPIITPIVPCCGNGVQPYLTLVKVGGDVNGPPLLVGDLVEYHVLAFNPATTTITNTWIEDYIPEHTSYVPGSAGVTPGALTGPDPLRVDVALQPGRGMVFLHFRVSVDPVTFVTTLTNTATAGVGQHPPVSARAVLGPVGGDDVGLVIGKTAEDLDGPPLYEGDTIEYVIGLANTDDVSHTHVVVTDAMPYGVTYASGSATPPPAQSPDPLVWTVKALPPHQILYFTFRVTVNAGMAGLSIGGNVAVADSDQQAEPVQTLPVFPAPVSPGKPPGYVWPPGLAIDKVAWDLDGPPLYEGDAVGYAITVTNHSTATTYTHLAVQDALPAGVSYVPGSADPPPDSGPDPLVWSVASLLPGESQVFTFRVTVDEGLAGQEIGGNVAAVLADQLDEPLVTPPVRPPGPVLPRPGVSYVQYLPLIARKYTPPGPVRLYLPLVVRAYTAGPPPGDAYEPDNTCAQARPLVAGAPQAHTFDPPGDEDWLAVSMTAGQSYILQTGNLTGGADTILQLYAPDCLVLLAENDDYGGELWSRLEWTAPETATYYARVRNYDPTVGGVGVGYAMSVQEVP
jgi:uncharacterized repeat protein (TIGR01451 family)